MSAVSTPEQGSSSRREQLLAIAARLFAEKGFKNTTVRDIAAILTSLGVGAAHWVGYSMGARVGLRAPLDAPSRVLSLTLESVSTGISDPVARDERRLGDDGLAKDIEERGIAWFVSHWESQPIFATQAFLPQSSREAQRARRLHRHRRFSRPGASPNPA